MILSITLSLSCHNVQESCCYLRTSGCPLICEYICALLIVSWPDDEAKSDVCLFCWQQVLRRIMRCVSQYIHKRHQLLSLDLSTLSVSRRVKYSGHLFYWQWNCILTYMWPWHGFYYSPMSLPFHLLDTPLNSIHIHRDKKYIMISWNNVRMGLLYVRRHWVHYKRATVIYSPSWCLRYLQHNQIKWAHRHSHT